MFMLNVEWKAIEQLAKEVVWLILPLQPLCSNNWAPILHTTSTTKSTTTTNWKPDQGLSNAIHKQEILRLMELYK